MELRVVTTEKGKILVDESADAKDGELVIQDGGLNRIGIGTHQASIAYTIKPLKIMASINHSISLDVPMVIVEDEVEKLAKEIVIKNNPNGVENFSMNVFNGLVNYITKSLKAQQKGVYSEEDLISFGKKCFYKGFNKSENDDANCFTAWKEEAPELIMDLKQEYIELEIEEVYSGETLASASGFSLKTDAIKSIKTSRVDGQLMAYLKQ